MVNSVGCPNNNCIYNYPTKTPVKVDTENTNKNNNIGYSTPIIRPNRIIPRNIPLENYGKALAELSIKMNLEPSLPTIINQDNINEIKGEKIYDSDGKLKAIINNENNYTTTYTLSDKNENMLEKISTKDNRTGKFTKEQENIIKDGKYAEMHIIDYGKTGKQEKHTVYVDGKLDMISSLDNTNKSKSTSMIRDITRNSKDYTEFQDLPNGNKVKNISFSDDDKRIVVYDEIQRNNQREENQVIFYNGALVSLKNTKEATMPNIVDFEKLADKDLAPSEKINVDLLTKDLETVDGIKTNYSNGNIESIEGQLNGKEGIIANFDVNGNLTKATFEKKTVEFSNSGSQRIIETMDNGAKKTTFYYNEGSKEVLVERDGYEKGIFYDKNDNPTSYHEKEPNKAERSFYYNKQGALEEKFEI